MNGFDMKHHANRMAAVDTPIIPIIPIIPTIAAFVRINPGTISLGQGFVNSDLGLGLLLGARGLCIRRPA